MFLLSQGGDLFVGSIYIGGYPPFMNVPSDFKFGIFPKTWYMKTRKPWTLITISPAQAPT